MKKLHSASAAEALVTAISAIRRVASASSLMWPLAMVLEMESHEPVSLLQPVDRGPDYRFS